MTVLVVDDSLTIRMDLCDALSTAGIPALACGSLAEARAAIAADDTLLSAAILDNRLPDGSGLELIPELRGDPRYAHTPILMLSSDAEVDDRVRGMAIGATDYVGKPYDTTLLIARLRALLPHTRTRTRDLPARGSHSVLVIDDSTTFREALCAELERVGYRTSTAQNGAEGLRQAAALRPSAIVVDGVMPDMDGPSVIRRVRLDPSLRLTPIVLLTGSEGENAELRALEAGADAFVTKDAEPEIILARLGLVLRTAGDAPPPLPIAAQRVLAIDDSPTFLAALTDAIRDEGYDLVTAATGEAALDLLAVQHVDCILLDPVLPGMSGLETCRRIKGAPGLRDIPLVMVTAHDGGIEMLAGLAAGADDFFAKAAGFDVLRARVRAQIRRRRFEDEHRARRELVLTNNRMEEANRLKSEFLANMSHELRTPLNAIIGFAELLHDGAVPADSPEHHEFLGDILTSGRHLLQLINDILDLAKVEAGKMQFRPEKIDAGGVFQEVCVVLRAQANARRVHVDLQVDATIGELFIDPARLKQVTFNYLSNALKFSYEDSVIVVRVMPEGDARFRLEVIDRGPGIAPEDLQRLFIEFNQLETTAAKRHQGTGLGLALTKRLVEEQGGTVGVASTVGEGSTFYAVLPRTARVPAG